MRKNKKKKDKGCSNPKGRDFKRKDNGSADLEGGRLVTPAPQGQKDANNDLSWYTRYPDLIAAAANLPFSEYPGSSVQFGSYTYRIPGVIALDFLPSVGISTGNKSPASQLALEIYSKVRSAFSGELQADGPDMVVYTLAMANIYMYIAWLKRIYRTLSSYSPLSYIMPDQLLYAYGLTDGAITSLRQNKTKLWGYINQLILEAGTFRVPKAFDVMNRYVFLCDNVFKDTEELSEAQLYVFNPRGFYAYTEQNTPDKVPASGLEMLFAPCDTRMTPSLEQNTAEVLFDFGQQLITRMKTWGTSYTINGYFGRAFEGMPTFTMDQVLESDLMIPSYSEEVLGQIENFSGITSTISNPNEFEVSGMAVSQDPKTNAVLSSNTVDVTVGVAMVDALNTPVLNIRGTNVPEKVVINTRLHGVVSTQTTSSTQMNTATEYPLWIRVIQGGVKSATTPYVGTVMWQKTLIQATGFQDSWFDNIMGIEPWDWHPLMMMIRNDNHTIYVNVDIHRLHTGGAHDLARLHEICLYSEYNAFSLIG